MRRGREVRRRRRATKTRATMMATTTTTTTTTTSGTGAVSCPSSWTRWGGGSGSACRARAAGCASSPVSYLPVPVASGTRHSSRSHSRHLCCATTPSTRSSSATPPRPPSEILPSPHPRTRSSSWAPAAPAAASSAGGLRGPLRRTARPPPRLPPRPRGRSSCSGCSATWWLVITPPWGPCLAAPRSASRRRVCCRCASSRPEIAPEIASEIGPRPERRSPSTWRSLSRSTGLRAHSTCCPLQRRPSRGRPWPPPRRARRPPSSLWRAASVASASASGQSAARPLPTRP